MNETFDLPVNYNGKDLFFPSRLIHSGYTHRFEVEVKGTMIFFEPDEERTYRAIADADTLPNNIDIHLLQAIAKSIEEVLK